MNCWWCWHWAATDCSGVVWGVLLDALSAIPSIFWAALYLNSIRIRMDQDPHRQEETPLCSLEHRSESSGSGWYIQGKRGEGWSFILWNQMEGKWEAPFEKLPQDRIKGAKKFGDTKKSQKRSRDAVGSRADCLKHWLLHLLSFGSWRNQFCSFCTSATTRSVHASRRKFQIPFHTSFYL